MTKNAPSPELFRKWTAIASVGVALERRCFVMSAGKPIFPNLFVLLVAPPGVGKSIIREAADEIWRRDKRLRIAPDDITKASLIDAMESSHQTRVYPPHDMLEYHALAVAADELGVLLPQHDLGFLNTMNVLFDARASYHETRRGRKDNPIHLINPITNMLAGTQPDYLAALLPQEAWGMGFMTRVIMVYAGRGPKVNIFGNRARPDYRSLRFDFETISELRGEFLCTSEAEEKIVAWYDAGLAPVPGHSKLKHYNSRRLMHFLKLCMISSASRENSLTIDDLDVDRARDWLIEVEALMPDIFKDMSGNSDAQVIQDLHYYLWELFAKNRKPLHISRISTFLAQRTPAYNVDNIIRVCQQSEIIISADHGEGRLWTPGNRNSTGEIG